MRIAALVLTLMAYSSVAQAEQIGAVNTAFNLFKSHQVVVEVFDDPKVAGVSCYFSRAEKGGLGGIVGLAQDPSDASVACRQVGTIAIKESLPKQEEVFSERASFLFKKVRIVRMVDEKRNALVYLIYSDRLIDGSPKNNITAVALPADVRAVVKK